MCFYMARLSSFFAVPFTLEFVAGPFCGFMNEKRGCSLAVFLLCNTISSVLAVMIDGCTLLLSIAQGVVASCLESSSTWCR
jgi:hypothetical protein